MAREIWHRITDFPDYEVNSRGHVRFFRNKQKLIPERGLITGVYKLWNQGDAKKIKAIDLLNRYFPELQEGGRQVEWRQLVNYPDYEASETGIIRNRSTKYEIPILRLGGFEPRVALWKNGVRNVCFLVQIMSDTFSKEAV